MLYMFSMSNERYPFYFWSSFRSKTWLKCCECTMCAFRTLEFISTLALACCSCCWSRVTSCDCLVFQAEGVRLLGIAAYYSKPLPWDHKKKHSTEIDQLLLNENRGGSGIFLHLLSCCFPPGWFNQKWSGSGVGGRCIVSFRVWWGYIFRCETGKQSCKLLKEIQERREAAKGGIGDLLYMFSSHPKITSKKIQNKVPRVSFVFDSHKSVICVDRWTVFYPADCKWRRLY